MTTVHDTPKAVIENATVGYYEGADAEAHITYEGRVELHEGWVRLCEPTKSWVPRERVEGIHEI